MKSPNPPAGISIYRPSSKALNPSSKAAFNAAKRSSSVALSSHSSSGRAGFPRGRPSNSAYEPRRTGSAGAEESNAAAGTAAEAEAGTATGESEAATVCMAAKRARNSHQVKAQPPKRRKLAPRAPSSGNEPNRKRGSASYCARPSCSAIHSASIACSSLILLCPVSSARRSFLGAMITL